MKIRNRGSKRLSVENLESRQMLTAVCSAGRDDFTVGLLDCTADTAEGYTLLAANTTDEAFLVDVHGRKVHEWSGAPFAGRRGARLGEDGALVSSGPVDGPELAGLGVTGALYIQDWDGDVRWAWEYNSPDYTLHHDVEIMPNGNLLAFAWVRHTPEELEALGRDPATTPEGGLWGERIFELEPVGADQVNIVWEWNLIDHLVQDVDPAKPNFGVIADNPGRMNINIGGNSGAVIEDWIHFNSIDYNADLDQIVVSAPFIDEFWVIDKSTTTAEAATSSGGNSGKGGDILYRWGNPGNYGMPGDQQVFNQHDVQWIDEGLPGAGNIMVFNNQAQPTTTVIEIEPPVDAMGNYSLNAGEAFAPAAPSYVLDTGVNAGFISGAHRQANGNTLVTHGPAARLLEYTPAGELVWSYTSAVTASGVVGQGDAPPATNTFKARKFGADFAGFAGRDLSPKGYVEAWRPGDYNLDDRFDLEDVNRMCENFSTGDRVFDLNFDDVVDQADLEQLLTLAGSLPGDANFDGQTDVADFNLWNANKFTMGTGWSTGDFNCDGNTDVLDFNIWNANKFSFAAAPIANPITVTTHTTASTANQPVVEFQADKLEPLQQSETPRNVRSFVKPLADNVKRTRVQSARPAIVDRIFQGMAE
ncbi:MAG: aryl-sulfate sulfotransferase [Planctomycetota bacterium]